MTPTDLYFKAAARIWQAYFETRAGRRYGENALSMTKRDELLAELRKEIKFRESKINDRELINKINEAKAKRLAESVVNAFKA